MLSVSIFKKTSDKDTRYKIMSPCTIMFMFAYKKECVALNKLQSYLKQSITMCTRTQLFAGYLDPWIMVT